MPPKKGTKRAASPAPVADAAAVSPAAAAAPAASRAKRSKKEEAAPAADEPAAASSAAAAPAKRGRAAAAAAVAAAAPAVSSPPTATSLAVLHDAKGAVGEVLAMGSGDCSQLGLGPDESMVERKKPTILKALTDARVSAVAIAAGSLHNLVLDRNHAVHSWGCNDDQALGRGSDEWLPAPVEGPLGLGNTKLTGVDVVQIACGASHSIALSAEGEVYCFGTFRDSSGVIGFSETMEAAKVPTLMTFQGTRHKIVQIAAGEHHDLALTEAGEVYQWGDIGIGRRFSDRKKKTKLTPSRVVFKKSGSTPAPKRLVRVYAGGHSSYAMDENGVAWFWGPNNYHQAGLPNPSKDELMVLSPTPILGLQPLAKVACATHHTLFLTRDGDVFSTGRGEDGRLGHGDMENYEKPTLIAALSGLSHGDKVVDVNCGESHSLCVTARGRLYSFGYGDLLQLGNGVEEDVGEPEVVTAKELDEGASKGFGRRVLQAAGGAQHSILLATARTSKAPWSGEVAAVKKAVVAEVKKTSTLESLRPTGGWECDTCLVYNKSDLKACGACETPRDGAAAAGGSSSLFFGAAAGSAAPAGAFSFGAAPAAGAAAAAPAFSFGAAPVAGAPAFSFGSAPAAAADSAAPATFSFGSGAVTFGSA